jgi:hypothetical protein
VPSFTQTSHEAWPPFTAALAAAIAGAIEVNAFCQLVPSPVPVALGSTKATHVHTAVPVSLVQAFCVGQRFGMHGSSMHVPDPAGYSYAPALHAQV